MFLWCPAHCLWSVGLHAVYAHVSWGDFGTTTPHRFFWSWGGFLIHISFSGNTIICWFKYCLYNNVTPNMKSQACLHVCVCVCASLSHSVNDKRCLKMEVHTETIPYMHYVYTFTSPLCFILHGAALISFTQIPQRTSLVFKPCPMCKNNLLI